MITFLRNLGRVIRRRLKLWIRGGPITVAAPQPKPDWPTPVGTEDFIAALAALDPGLTVRPERAVRRGYRVLEAIQRHDGDQAKILDYVRQEFDGGHASVDTVRATEIIAVCLRCLPV